MAAAWTAAPSATSSVAFGTAIGRPASRWTTPRHVWLRAPPPIKKRAARGSTPDEQRDANPGGKLPITVPRRTGQIPIYYGHKPSGGRSHWQGPYVDGSNLPLWPFGFGMSYTTFEVTDIRLDKPRVPIDGEFTVGVSIRNTGPLAGDEVVQLYVRDEEASVTRPLKQLRGFKRVRLDPGESRRVDFTVAVEQLAFTAIDGKLRIEPGVVALMVGTSSEDLPCSAQVEVVGEAGTLDRRTRYFTRVAVE